MKNQKNLTAQKKFSIKKLIGETINTTFLMGFAAGAVWTGVEGVKEIIETQKGDNEVIDFDYGLFSIIFKNNETRELEELLADLEDAILDVENIDKAFSEPQNLTREQKEQIIQEIIDAMKETANLNTSEFSFKEMGNTGGYYFTIYNKYASIVNKKITLNENYMDNNFSDVVWGTIHEMMHAVYNENIMRSDKVSRTDKEAFYAKQTIFQKDNRLDYVSSYHELVPQLFAARLMTYFEVNYGTCVFGSQIEAGIKCAILTEMTLNLYGQKTGLNYNFNFMPQEHIEIYAEDEKNYKLLTIKELSKLALAQKYDIAKVKYNDDELETSNYLKVLNYYFGEEVMNVRYVDYIHRNYNPNIDNVTEDIENFESYLLAVSETNKDVVTAQQIAAYVNIFRYQSQEYSAQDKMLLSNTIFKYLDDISQNYIKTFGLQDASELVSEAIDQLSIIDDEIQM